MLLRLREDLAGLGEREGALFRSASCVVSRALELLRDRLGCNCGIVLYDNLGALRGGRESVSSWRARIDLRSRGDERVGDVMERERPLLRDTFKGDTSPSGFRGTFETVWNVCKGLVLPRTGVAGAGS